jgi:hypothetical protein
MTSLFLPDTGKLLQLMNSFSSIAEKSCSTQALLSNLESVVLKLGDNVAAATVTAPPQQAPAPAAATTTTTRSNNECPTFLSYIGDQRSGVFDGLRRCVSNVQLSTCTVTPIIVVIIAVPTTTTEYQESPSIQNEIDCSDRMRSWIWSDAR